MDNQPTPNTNPTTTPDPTLAPAATTPTPEPAPSAVPGPVPTPATSPVPAGTQPPTNNKTNIIIIVVIVVLALAGIGVGAWLFFKNKSKSASNKKTDTSQTQKKETSNTKDTNSTIDPKYAKCLRPDDYSVLTDIDMKYWDDKTEATVWGNTFFFQPDSTDYSYPEGSTEIYDKLEAFYKKYSGSTWDLELKGQIKDIDGSGNSASNIALANKRAAKVEAELVNRGFDKARITILEPEVYPTSFGTDDSDRNVDLTLSSQCKPDPNQDM